MKGLPDIICSNAERKFYGVKDKDAITYIDESPNALWNWELTNSSLLPLTTQKQNLASRNILSAIASKSKALDKLIRLIDKANSIERDLPRIVEEYEKYNKIVRKENTAAQANL